MDFDALIRAYLRAIENDDWPAVEALYAPEVVQREFPNRLVPQGATRDLAALREASVRGRKVMQGQTYEVHQIVVQGERVAVETTWRGVLAVPLGTLKGGDTMVARFAMFFVFRDGRIVEQHNYDCFDPF